MNILFSSIHNIDIDGEKIELRDKVNDFDDVLSTMLRKIDLEENVKKCREKNNSTKVYKEVYQSCKLLEDGKLDESEFNKSSGEIAQKLLEVEIDIQAQLKVMGNDIQRGAILQAIVYNDIQDVYEYYIAKLEHSEFYIEENFIKTNGFQSGKAKVYKSCKFILNNIEGIEFQSAEVYLNHKASYWIEKFLELEEINNDEDNTKTAYYSIQAVLSQKVKQKYKADFQMLRNAFIGYLRAGVRIINFTSMIDEVLDEYKSINIPQDKLQDVKETLLKLPEKKKFDTQFKSIPKAITRIRQHYQLNKGIELILNRNDSIDDLEHAIVSIEEGGKRYLKILITDSEAFETFMRKTN